MKLFKFNAYTRTAIAMLFHHIQQDYPNSYMVTGYNQKNQTTSFSGEIQFGDADCYFKATEKLKGITLEFHCFDETIEETVYSEMMYGGIKVKFPNCLQGHIRPLLMYLKPENVLHDALVPVLHATVEDFSRAIEQMSEVDEEHRDYGIEAGFYFHIMGCRAIRDMILGTRDGKLIFIAIPRPGCDMNEFITQLQENVFIPETLYQFVDEVVVPA